MRPTALKNNLHHSLRDGFFYSLMVGLGESYLAAYVLAKGFSDLSASLITTIPLLAGAILQLISPAAVLLLGSYRRWVVTAALIQALSLALIAITALIPDFPLWGLFFLVSIYWGAGMSTGPTWNAWISYIIPYRVRIPFFTRRSQISHAAVFIGLILGGLSLQLTDQSPYLTSAFFGLFITAFASRIYSALYLSRQTEPPEALSTIENISLHEMFLLFSRSTTKKLLLFMLFFTFTVYTSAGLFTPFMLSQIELPFWTYTLLLSTALASRIWVMNYSKMLIKSIGLPWIVFVSSLGIAPLPYLWTLWDNLFFLIFLQVIAGVTWALFELATFLILFNDLTIKERTGVLTLYNLLQTLAIILGSLVGGALFYFLGSDLIAYFVVFDLSSALRFLALLTIPETSLTLRQLTSWIMIRSISVRFHGGAFGRPLTLRIPLRKKAPLPPSPTTTPSAPSDH